MFLFRKLRLIFLYSQFKRLRSELIYQNAGRDTVQDAEEDGHSAENHGGHPDLHHKKAYEIRDDRHYAVCSALNLRACVIRLQQIVNRQIMHRKENAQADDRHEKHRIVYGVFRPSGSVQQLSLIHIFLTNTSFAGRC